MSQSALKRFVTVLLLAFYALLSTAPGVLIAPAQQHYGTKDASSCFQEGSTFLLDVHLRQLNKTRQSELIRPADNIRLSGRDSKCKDELQAAAEATAAALRLMDMSRLANSSYRSRSSAIRFSFSGTSPPFLLS